jgi:hypothetical protein
MTSIDKDIDAMQWKIEGKCMSCGKPPIRKAVVQNDVCDECFISDQEWRHFLQIMEKHKTC